MLINSLTHAANGSQFVSVVSSSILGNGHYAESKRLENLCRRVEQYIKQKEETTLPAIIEELKISASDAIRCLRMLRTKGLIHSKDDRVRSQFKLNP